MKTLTLLLTGCFMIICLSAKSQGMTFPVNNGYSLTEDAGINPHSLTAMKIQFSGDAENGDNEETSNGNGEETGKMAYRPGEFRFNIGTSFWRWGYGYRYTSLALGVNRRGTALPIYASLEAGIHDFISIGGIIGYYSWGYSYTADRYVWYDGHQRTGRMSRSTMIGGTGTFHLMNFMDEEGEDFFGLSDVPSQLDLYGTLTLAARIVSETIEYRDIDDETSRNYGLGFGISFGARYYFTDNFAAYAEVGRGLLGWGTIGITLRM